MRVLKNYAIQENKARIETLNKEEIEQRLSPIVENTEPTGGTLFLIADSETMELIVNNSQSPNTVAIGISSDYQTVSFRFNKSIGSGGYANSYISLTSSIEKTVKYINNPDTTTWSRMFLTVYVDGNTVYIKTDGC